ncbi:hypothetical protein [Streptomyces sp. NL15-2K]|uniref:hypothetical protein n=1 Tax=Streptomyces sp. NL15-2K TaxID=376149 RepID=UPI0035B54A15
MKERADGFATDLERVSSALESYATEIRPLDAKLKELKAKAVTFVDSVKDDDEWEYDGDKVDEHNQIRDEITATVAAFWAAERTCHNKITALWGGTQMVAGDGSDRKDQYGFSADDMKNAQVPWGDPVEEKHHWYEVGHWVKSFVWDGLIVDGIWGTIKGLGTLVGFGGWEAMGQAWKGLAQLATGLAISAVPGAAALFWTMPDDKMPSWLRDSRTAMKETGKALVAWDEWGKNPARAAGAVTFNVLTTVFTGGAGGAAAGAGKAGAVAKALSVAGKAGRVLDPMTYIAKGAGAGLSKIGDIAASLKGVGNIDIPTLPDNAITLPEGAVKLPDGTVNLPEGAAIPEGATRLPDGNFQLPHDTPVVPAGTTKLPSADGSPAQYMDADGNLLDQHGNVIDSVDNAPTDVVDKGTSGSLASGADMPRVDSSVRAPALVGAGAHTAEQAGQHIRLGDSLSDNLGDAGRVGEDVPTTPAVHASGDVPTAHTGGDLPGGTASDHLPGGRAEDLTKGPSASHEPPSSHTGGSDSPVGNGHDHGGTGGHGDSPSVGSHHEIQSSGNEGAGSPSDAGHATPANGHTDLPGGGHSGGRPIDEISPDRYSTGEHASRPPSEPMRPEQEAALTEALTREKMSAADQAKVLRTLGKEPFGAEVADLLSRGHLSGTKNYQEILNMCKQGSKGEQKGMIPAAYMALSHATDLQSKGFTHLAFELKDEATGLDLDVTTLRPDGTPHYGYQLKDVDNIQGIRSASKSAAKQLLPDVVGAKKVAILDVHQPMAELNAKMFKEVEFQARRTGATFHLRFHDGSVTVPANGHPLFP